MATNSRADLLKECRTTTMVVELNADDLEHAQGDRESLADTVARIEEADVRQKHHKFQFQQASRDLDQLTSLARDLLLRLKNFVRGKYGMTSEKLAEFGLNPRRSTKKKPSETGPTPTETAAPGTDGTTQK
ncbi:MAG TPA: hypothetical protein VF179_02965 [Thermoanaerobaculia bacterium]|nr:hypothetical protein [Thermoanaerobaculia bacterium]